ncbi:hypothetical protein ACHAWU_008739 [Discostella pseudostelligera]|uniref:Uncharacterized protein n=1 Tax=Discostella pseudostelligera TaxID=259834 RepID=A0ABD3MZ97_9STRA
MTDTTQEMEPTIESRLAELELKVLGTEHLISTNANGIDGDISSRLDKLMRSAPTPAAVAAAARGKTKTSSTSSSSSTTTSITNSEALLSKQRSALHEDYRVIDRLLSELDISPTAGPTATASVGGGGDSNINTSPLICRRMEILASCETMKRDMDLLAQIRDLTTIGTKADIVSGDGGIGSTTSSASSSRVVNCPIISSERYNLSSNPEAIQQLESICLRVARVIERCAMASQRADGMLDAYGKIMMALSEKMVLAEEQIRSYNDRGEIQ